MKENAPKKLGRPPKKQPIDDGANVVGAIAVGITPLDYMLAVIRDPTAAQTRRDRMAVAAAPYCHPRVSDLRVGKKEQMEIAAVASAEGSDWGDLLMQ